MKIFLILACVEAGVRSLVSRKWELRFSRHKPSNEIFGGSKKQVFTGAVVYSVYVLLLVCIG
jgi:hypothetical protein